MRATRQTELEESFPTHVVCSWLGNSPKVAGEHFCRSLRALRKAVQNPVQKAVQLAGPQKDVEPLEQSGNRENQQDIRGDVIVRGSVQNQKVERGPDCHSSVVPGH